MASFSAPPYLLIDSDLLLGHRRRAVQHDREARGAPSRSPSRTSKRQGGRNQNAVSRSRVHCSGVNLLAPCEVPIEMASESTPVLGHEVDDLLGLRIGDDVRPTRHPRRRPARPARLRPSRRTGERSRRPSSSARHSRRRGSAEPSIITDEKPMSMHDLAKLERVAVVEVQHDLRVWRSPAPWRTPRPLRAM